MKFEEYIITIHREVRKASIYIIIINTDVGIVSVDISIKTIPTQYNILPESLYSTCYFDDSNLL